MENYLNTAQKMKFSIKDFFGKCDQIRCALKSLNVSVLEKFQIKSLILNFVYCKKYHSYMFLQVRN